MAIDAQALYQEFQNDPTAIGYAIGNGVSFLDKQDQINGIRGTIQITRVATEDTPGPGEVQEGLAIQLIRDAIDSSEWDANCRPQSGDDQVVIGQKESTRARIITFYSGQDGNSLFGFTTLAKNQILALFTNANWPTTRGNLINLQTREGTRAEQLFGGPPAPVTRDDMLAAEAWGQANGQPTLYE